MTRRQFSQLCIVVVCILIGSTVRPPTVCAQGQDTTPPALQDFSFSPTAIDTTSGEQVVTVTAHATDDLSGVSVIYVSFLSPSGSQIQQGIISRISGNANDGIYQGSFSFPQYGKRAIGRSTGST